MKLSKKRLLFDLYQAYNDAKKGKSNRDYVVKFEEKLHENLESIRDELYERRYEPHPSVCFIIEEPKKREIFAANFRDRIVHHLYYNYTYELFNNTFIEDSYSCRKGKGTHYGIHRLEKHIRQETENHSKKAFVLKMDIKGYFIHINRLILLDIVNNTLDKMSRHKPKGKNTTWEERLDYDFIKYFGKVIILSEPTRNCIIKGRKSDWKGLPDSKTLFKTEKDCGLPIGNLTSQLFSNVYLNVFDQFMKRTLKCRHYGRYVDDFYVVSKDKDFLKGIVKEITHFMKENLKLDIQEKKTHIIDTELGVEFLGAFVKPYRTYLSNRTIKRIKRGLYEFQHDKTDKDVVNMVNSYLGLFSHWKSNSIKKELFSKIDKLNDYGYFKEEKYKKFIRK